MNPVDRLQHAPRCAATSKRTHQGCKGPAVNGWSVCRFHGARGGAPSGPSNGAYKNGEHTKEAVASRASLRRLLKQTGTLTATMRSGENIDPLRIIAMQLDDK